MEVEEKESIPYADDPKCPIVNIKQFYLYYAPVIIILGLVGNTLTLLVFTTTHLKTRSSSYYLAALSCADLMYIITILIVHCTFIKWIDTYNKEGWCQGVLYVNGICNTLSVWFVVAFTIERFIAVQYPLERPHICTVKRAKITIIVLIAVACFSQLYYFAAAGIVTAPDGNRECELLDDSFTLMRVINAIDLITTFVIPFILIVIMNTMIVCKIFHFKDGLAKKVVLSTLPMNSNSSRLNTNSSVRSCTTRTCKISNHPDNCQCQSIKRRRIFSRPSCLPNSQHNITKMLVITSSVFLILNLPSFAVRFYIFMHNLISTGNHFTPYLWCWQQISMILFYTNFSINFLLYSMCGVTFRRCLLQLLRDTYKTVFVYSNEH